MSDLSKRGINKSIANEAIIAITPNVLFGMALNIA